MTQLAAPPTSDRGSIPAALRPLVGVTVGVGFGAFVALSLLVAGKDGPLDIERDLMGARLTRQSGPLLLRLLMVPGSGWVVWLATVGFVVWGIYCRDWARVLAPASILGSIWIVENVMKPLVDRMTVGWHPQACFPSGTATGVAAWLTLLWVALLPFVQTRRSRGALGLLCGAIVVLDGWAIAVTGKHYPLDVVGGVVFGLVAVLAWCLLLDHSRVRPLDVNHD